ncbi:MAG: acylneuraminate cytidylyltransferase family protein [Nitrosarchaeum sp.]|nr:acylneuraminate cytidylyltransferase family protein [Nitrosarchaeum sp.]
MKVLAIIPARGGSKGVPLKNIKKLNGKPLIKYTIDAAKKSKLLNRIIVSTDNEKIASLAKKYGAEVPFTRPKKISGSQSTQFQVVKHALDFLKTQKYFPDIVVLLQPTSPFRRKKIIDDSITKLIKSKATCVVSVMPMKQHPYASFWIKNGMLKPFKKDFDSHGIRQKRPILYYPTGSVYTFFAKNILQYKSIYGPKMKPIVEDESSLDIDTPLDFFICEMVSKHGKNKNKF